MRPLSTAIAAVFSKGSSTTSQRPTFRKPNTAKNRITPATKRSGRNFFCELTGRIVAKSILRTFETESIASYPQYCGSSNLAAQVKISSSEMRGGGMRAIVTGGAGFLGSHLCDRLLAEGWDGLALDNLITGAEDNIAHLQGNKHFRY